MAMQSATGAPEPSVAADGALTGFVSNLFEAATSSGLVMFLQGKLACCGPDATGARQEMWDAEGHGLFRHAFDDEEDVLLGDIALPKILGRNGSDAALSKSGLAAWNAESLRAWKPVIATPAGSMLSDRSTALGSSALSSSSSCGDGLEDRPATFVKEDGCTYTGQWLGDTRQGWGVAKWSNGQKYEGQFRDNLPHGRGVFTEADGSTFDGRWEEGEKHGHGVYFHADGSCYQGNWLHNVKCGNGTERWPDGAKYEGQYVNGCKHGRGIFTDGPVQYMGEFLEDKMHGQGSYLFRDRRKYFGGWVDGKMSGEGRMEWPSGAVYEGSYESGLRSGEGSMLMPDGSRHVGLWKQGKQDGAAVCEDAQGRRRSEVWSEGVRVSSEEAVGATGA
eukprot:CAMPEP_0204142022 /NCGR_PEP_ID=MMETSP0361-20130328/19775_1 /ASSEMBLY_ACC=CAM_ASM_000343 /TAXON_ID=268821 /ORGANISM="Scrippsiella Hangoei, Strain SHTV-5" /LENGTH=389 /DNA_ID=CAMNT_0051095843 /DNA_START=56 /DNA_END=1225 /DNA_ORIENTATION=+